jgi:hypothetical protein
MYRVHGRPSHCGVAVVIIDAATGNCFQNISYEHRHHALHDQRKRLACLGLCFSLLICCCKWGSLLQARYRRCTINAKFFCLVSTSRGKQTRRSLACWYALEKCESSHTLPRRPLAFPIPSTLHWMWDSSQPEIWPPPCQRWITKRSVWILIYMGKRTLGAGYMLVSQL